MTAMKVIIATLGLATAGLLAYPANLLSGERPVLAGRVIKVIDGDTIDVQLQSGPIRIRFHGIDAPEKAQDHGKEATATLSQMVMGKQVQIEAFQQDRYERLVGIVYLGELNVNSRLVRDGHAWAMRRYLRKEDAELCRIEAEARLNRRGLWASTDAVAPWSYRRRPDSSEHTPPSAETAESCIAAIGKPYR
jgi:endonuclease YncB( thermonuclease family)